MATEKVIDMFLWLEENKQKKHLSGFRKKILIVDDDLGPRESIPHPCKSLWSYYCNR